MWARLLDFQVLSGAAGSSSYGAIFKSHWFSGAWSVKQSSLSIAYNKRLPIIVEEAYVWDPQYVY